MDCKDIREKFSAYIEGTVSHEEKAIIETHLKSCPRCSQELSELSKTIEHLKNLEEVSPPLWLTQKVMASIRGEARPKKGLFQRLFYPLYIKLPVGAIATIAIALTTLYIFKTIEPEIRLAKAPPEEAVPQVLSKDAIPPSPPLAKGGEGGFEPGKSVPARPSEELKKILPSSPLTPPVLPFPHSGGFAEVKDKGRSKEGLSAPKAPAPVSEKDRSAPATGALAKEEAKSDTAPAAPRLKAMMEEKKDIIMITIHVKDIEFARKEIERCILELGGKVLKKESYENKDILTTEIDSGKLKEFFERLKSVGQVREKDSDFEVMKGELQARIEIVKTPPQ